MPFPPFRIQLDRSLLPCTAYVIFLLFLVLDARITPAGLWIAPPQWLLRIGLWQLEGAEVSTRYKLRQDDGVVVVTMPFTRCRPTHSNTHVRSPRDARCGRVGEVKLAASFLRSSGAILCGNRTRCGFQLVRSTKACSVGRCRCYRSVNRTMGAANEALFKTPKFWR